MDLDARGVDLDALEVGPAGPVRLLGALYKDLDVLLRSLGTLGMDLGAPGTVPPCSQSGCSWIWGLREGIWVLWDWIWVLWEGI